MSVYSKKSSPFLYIGFDMFGETFERPSGGTNKRVAESMEREWRRQLQTARDSGTLLPGKTVTMDVAGGIYWQGLLPAKRTPTLERNLAEVIGLIGPDTPITSVDTLMMDAIMADYRERPNKHDPGRKIGVASANMVPDLVSRVLNKARKALRIRLPDQPARWEHYVHTDERIRELSYEEERRLAAVAPHDLFAPCEFMIELGLRRTNCVTLRWNQIDWENMMIAVRQKGGQFHHVQISGRAAEILEMQRRSKHRDPEFVFTFAAKIRMVRKGKAYQPGDRVPWKAGYFSKCMREVFKQAGIEDFVVHDFRHTCATRLLRVSNIDIVRKLLGHITERMSRRYTKLVENDVRGAQMARQVMDDAQRQRAIANDGRRDDGGNFAALTVAGAYAMRHLLEGKMRDLAMEPLRQLRRAA